MRGGDGVSDVEIRRNEIIELLYTYKNIASMILRNGSASLAAQSIMILFTLWTFTKLTRSPVRMEEAYLKPIEIEWLRRKYNEAETEEDRMAAHSILRRFSL